MYLYTFQNIVHLLGQKIGNLGQLFFVKFLRVLSTYKVDHISKIKKLHNLENYFFLRFQNITQHFVTKTKFGHSGFFSTKDMQDMQTHRNLP